MVIKKEEIIKALCSLEMRGGMHMIPEELRRAIMEALEEKPKRGRPPKQIGKAPE